MKQEGPTIHLLRARALAQAGIDFAAVGIGPCMQIRLIPIPANGPRFIRSPPPPAKA